MKMVNINFNHRELYERKVENITETARNTKRTQLLDLVNGTIFFFTTIDLVMHSQDLKERLLIIFRGFMV